MNIEIKKFFDRFVADFPSFDGKIISQRYLAPYTAVNREGDLWVCRDGQDLIEYFQTLLDKHASEGVVACKYEDLETAEIGSRCHHAAVTWTMMGAEGETISNWRESYNLIEVDAELRIFTSIDH